MRMFAQQYLKNMAKKDRKQEIIDFAKKSLQEKPEIIEKLLLGELTESEIKQMQTLTSLDLQNYQRIIDNYAVRHTIKKHGSESTEKLRGQLAVNEEDLGFIPEIMENPDLQKDGGINKIGRQTVVSSKEMEKGNYIYVEEVRNKKEELAMQTLYIQKKKKG